MTKEQLNAAIMNEIEDIIYVLDMETHDLLYMNSKAMDAAGVRSECEWKGRPCYQVLYGLESPCSSCPNSIVAEKGGYTWERFVARTGRYLYQMNKLISVEGKRAKLCVSTDITVIKKTAEELHRRLLLEETLIKCVRTLYEGDNAELAINRLLSIIAEYHGADRAYIIEFEENGMKMNNTYEWCRTGIEPQIDLLQNLDISIIDRWLVQFEQKGEFFIDSLQEDVDKESEEYKILEVQGIESLMAAPLCIEGKIFGFLGVDNPRKSTESLLLLQSVAAFVINDIQKRKDTAKLYELSYIDRLSGVGNRHAYVKSMEELEGKEYSLGIVFADINGLKIANGSFGHKRGDEMIREVARVLRSRFQNIFRVGGDEFVVFCEKIGCEEFEKTVEELIRSWDSDATASIGHLWLEKCERVEEQVARADRLMYVNKKEYYRKNGIEK